MMLWIPDGGRFRSAQDKELVGSIRSKENHNDNEGLRQSIIRGSRVKSKNERWLNVRGCSIQEF